MQSIPTLEVWLDLVHLLDLLLGKLLPTGFSRLCHLALNMVVVGLESMNSFQPQY